MKKLENLIAILDEQHLPPRAALNELHAIVDAKVTRVAALPICDAYSYFLMIAIDAYNYGIMQGKRIERERRNTGVHRPCA
jgi:hypothetical protein